MLDESEQERFLDHLMHQSRWSPHSPYLAVRREFRDGRQAERGLIFQRDVHGALLKEHRPDKLGGWRPSIKVYGILFDDLLDHPASEDIAALADVPVIGIYKYAYYLIYAGWRPDHDEILEGELEA